MNKRQSSEYYQNCAFPKPRQAKKETPKVSKKTYEIVFNACKGRCVLCSKSIGLELHHCLGRGKDLTDNYKYCVMLCRNCHHNVVHGNLKKYRPILLEICEAIYEP